MGRDKGRGKPLPWEVGWIHGRRSLFSETLTTAAQRAGGIRYADEFDICMGLFSGHENTSGGAAPNCFLDRIAATDAARNAFVAEWGQPAEKKRIGF